MDLPNGRTLVLRKGQTWINISGSSDGEVVRIAESLQRVGG